MRGIALVSFLVTLTGCNSEQDVRETVRHETAKPVAAVEEPSENLATDQPAVEKNEPQINNESVGETTSETADAPDESQTFNLKPRQGVMPGLVNYYRPIRIQLSDKPQEQLVREPDYESDAPLYGILTVGNGPDNRISIVVDEVDPGNSRIHIDRNNDEDLTNDGPAKWSRNTSGTLGLSKVSVDVPYGTEVIPATFEFYRFKTRLRDVVLYYRNSAREGILRVGDAEYQIAVLDENADGRYDDLDNGTLLIDLDQDGQLIGRSDSAEHHALDQPFNIHGNVFQVASLSPDGTQLTISPSSADVEMRAYLTVGNPAPHFGGKTVNDEEVDLLSLSEGADYVLLDFWASWCGPCRKEYPYLRRLHARYKNHGLRIIGINLDSSRDKAIQAAQENQLSYPHVFDGQGWKNAVAVLYRIHAIPATYLLDKDLKIVAKGLRGASLESRMAELLGRGDAEAVEALDAEIDKTAPSRQIKPASPAIRNSRSGSVDHPILTPEESKSGFLVNTRDGLRFITPDGEVKKLPTKNTGGRFPSPISAFDGRIFLYRGQSIQEIDVLGKVLRTISIESGARGHGFEALPENRFAVLDNSGDKIYLLNRDGSLAKTLDMLHKSDRHLQNTAGVVVDDSLIISEDGNNKLLKVELATGQVSVFRNLSNLRGWLGAISHDDGTFYLCQSSKVYSFTEDSDLSLIATLDRGNITGIAVRDNSAYVCVNFTGKVYKIDVSNGNMTVFAEGLNYPHGMIGISNPERP